ncbi:MAG: radical SAM/SPASM domain-containing protein, partial [Eggerthella lenta]
ADRALVRTLQDDLGGTLRPFALAAERASGHAGRALREAWAVERTRQLLEAGAIRRFGAMVRHRRMGFSSNAMGVWDVPDELALEAGAILSAPAGVSHCYERPRRATWPYNLYTMIHGRDRASCERVAARLHADLADAGIEVEPPRLLLSAREFKKTSMRYFEEDL